MKIRIKGNSIRIRLMQAEVQQLKEVHELEEEVSFPRDHSFIYGLKLGESHDAIFKENRLLVIVPSDEAHQWIASPELSLSYSIAIEKGVDLAVLIEKDLACMTPQEGEDESDAFPNPKR